MRASLVAGLTLLLAVGACGPAIETRALGFSVDADANDRSPVPIELVVAYDPEVVPLLLELTARQWFERRSQLLLDHPTALRSELWELVPGQELPIERLPLPRDDAHAAVIYADYLTPGAHRIRIDPYRRVLVRVTREELVVDTEAENRE
ncbi:MAG: hypothetical protein WD737_02900 [Gemmatimonadota bacterium]